MTDRRALEQLAALLRGERIRDVDWANVLTLANAQLVTQRLANVPSFISMPADVRAFVRDVNARNQLRNKRLLDQLDEVAAALNAGDMVPLVIKGGARLAVEGAAAPRIVSDLDLVLPPERTVDALAVLDDLGFAPAEASHNPAHHAAATLQRFSDVGQIDLHRRPPGPPGILAATDVRRHCYEVRLNHSRILVPRPYAGIYFQVLHDQLHDKAFWRGGLDLRHLWDAADLVRRGGVDWDALYGLAPTRHVAHAISLQLALCRRYTGAVIAPRAGETRDWHAQLNHVQTLSRAALYPIMGMIVLCELGPLLLHRRQERRLRADAALPGRRSGLVGSFINLQRLLRRKRS